MSPYSQLTSFILGFHGCDLDVAERIFAGKETLRQSLNTYDWLGEGIYFWEQSPLRAIEYARHLGNGRRRSGPRIQTPAVIGAVIDYGNCLNLLDSMSLKLVEGGFRRLAMLSQESNLELPKNRGGTGRNTVLRDLDCAVINFLHQSRTEEGLKPFDTVRSAFIEGDPLYPTAGFYSKNHIQLCVRNENCIKGYFRPRFDPDASDDL